LWTFLTVSCKSASRLTHYTLLLLCLARTAGVYYDKVVIDANGVLSFTDGNALSSGSVAQLTASVPLIASFWTALDPTSGGTVYAGALNSGTFAVAFDNVPVLGVNVRSSTGSRRRVLNSDVVSDVASNVADVDFNSIKRSRASTGVSTAGGDTRRALDTDTCLFTTLQGDGYCDVSSAIVAPSCNNASSAFAYVMVHTRLVH
jgi:hypothetical protein